MEQERKEQIERWAEYVASSNGEWHKSHNKFIDAQFDLANSFYKRLSPEKVKEIRTAAHEVKKEN